MEKVTRPRLKVGGFNSQRQFLKPRRRGWATLPRHCVITYTYFLKYILPTVMIKPDRSQQEIKYLGIANISGSDNDGSKILCSQDFAAIFKDEKFPVTSI